MISFALTGKREEVLAKFQETKGTQKKLDTPEFVKAVQDAVTAEVSKIPAEETQLALEVKAHAADDGKGGVKHIKIVAYPLANKEEN